MNLNGARNRIRVSRSLNCYNENILSNIIRSRKFEVTNDILEIIRTSKELSLRVEKIKVRRLLNSFFQIVLLSKTFKQYVRRWKLQKKIKRQQNIYSSEQKEIRDEVLHIRQFQLPLFSHQKKKELSEHKEPFRSRSRSASTTTPIPKEGVVERWLVKYRLKRSKTENKEIIQKYRQEQEHKIEDYLKKWLKGRNKRVLLDINRTELDNSLDSTTKLVPILSLPLSCLDSNGNETKKIHIDDKTFEKPIIKLPLNTSKMCLHNKNWNYYYFELHKIRSRQFIWYHIFEKVEKRRYLRNQYCEFISVKLLSTFKAPTSLPKKEMSHILETEGKKSVTILHDISWTSEQPSENLILESLKKVIPKELENLQGYNSQYYNKFLGKLDHKMKSIEQEEPSKVILNPIKNTDVTKYPHTRIIFPKEKNYRTQKIKIVKSIPKLNIKANKSDIELKTKKVKREKPYFTIERLIHVEPNSLLVSDSKTEDQKEKPNSLNKGSICKVTKSRKNKITLMSIYLGTIRIQKGCLNHSHKLLRKCRISKICNNKKICFGKLRVLPKSNINRYNNINYVGKRYVIRSTNRLGPLKKYGISSFKRYSRYIINENRKSDYSGFKLLLKDKENEYMNYFLQECEKYVRAIHKHHELISIFQLVINKCNTNKLGKIMKYTLQGKVSHLEEYVDEVFGELLVNGDFCIKTELENNSGALSGEYKLQDKIRRLRYILNEEHQIIQNEISTELSKCELGVKDETKDLWDKLSKKLESTSVTSNISTDNSEAFGTTSQFVYENEDEMFRQVYYDTIHMQKNSEPISEDNSMILKELSKIKIHSLRFNNNRSCILFNGMLSPWMKLAIMQKS